MRFHCDYCGTRYRAEVDEARILGSRLVLTCKKCGRDIVAVGGEEKALEPAFSAAPPDGDEALDDALDSALDQSLDRMMKAQSELGPWKLGSRRVDQDLEELPIGEKTLVRSLERGLALGTGDGEGPGPEREASPAESVPAPATAPVLEPVPAPVPEPEPEPEPEVEHGLRSVRFAAIGLVAGAALLVAWLVLSRGREAKAPSATPVPPAATPVGAAVPAIPSPLPADSPAGPAAAPVPTAPTAPTGTAAPATAPLSPTLPPTGAPPKASPKEGRADEGAARKPQAAAPSAPPAPQEPGEELPAAPPEEAIDSAFGRIVANARLCWIQGPGAAGTGVSAGVTVTVAPSGEVTKVAFDRPGLDGTPFGDCVRKAARRAAFPRFSGRAVEVKRTVSLGGP